MSAPIIFTYIKGIFHNLCKPIWNTPSRSVDRADIILSEPSPGWELGCGFGFLHSRARTI
nr:MAG TPA: hypothetical protein [Caudoviricetes sp.]